MKKLFNIICILGIVSSVFCSCKKFVAVNGPITSVNSKNIFTNDATAIGSITSLYSNLSLTGLTSTEDLTSISCISGLSSDELTYYSGAGINSLAVYYQNALTDLNVSTKGYWGSGYQRLYLVNTSLEQLNASTALNPNVKKQLLGEANFMRAFYYFYLVNLYGDIPLVLGTDYKANALITKSSKEIIYQQIITDLKKSKSLLSDKYLKGDVVTPYSSGSEERVRPTSWAASALLARTFLYTKDWANAELEATLVIDNTKQYQLLSKDHLGDVFLKTSKEAIWQLQPVEFGANSQEARVFILPSTGPSNLKPVYLSDNLVNSFDNRDKRRTQWISGVNVDGNIYYFPNKYKIDISFDTDAPVTEYTTVIRLAELVLVRAEARAQQGNLDGAIADLDLIKDRVGLPKIKDINPNVNKTDLIDIIIKEKQFELFTEWGHRWFDLKRTGKIDQIMPSITPKKVTGGVWKSYQQYYPIPSNELKNNPILTQVNGY